MRKKAIHCGPIPMDVMVLVRQTNKIEKKKKTTHNIVVGCLFDYINMNIQAADHLVYGSISEENRIEIGIGCCAGTHFLGPAIRGNTAT